MTFYFRWSVIEKDKYLNWGWHTAPSVIDENMPLKQHHIFFDCDALAVLRFRHLSHHFLKTGNYADISISNIYFVSSAGWLHA